MQTPSIGRVVRWVHEDSRLELPAIITAVSEDGVNIQIFLDMPGTLYRRNVKYSASCEYGTWHWPDLLK
jgi:hypothetical protein